MNVREREQKGQTRLGNIGVKETLGKRHRTKTNKTKQRKR